MVHIPRRQIDSQFKSFCPTGIRHLPHNISLSILPGGRRHREVGIFRGPQTETVVMLAGQKHQFHPSLLGCTHPLSGIQLRRVEQGEVFLTCSPLSIRERIDTKTDKTSSLHLLPGHLPLGRHHVCRQTDLLRQRSILREYDRTHIAARLRKSTACRQYTPKKRCPKLHDPIVLILLPIFITNRKSASS